MAPFHSTRSLSKSFDNAGIAIAETYLAPVAMGECVLTEAEKRAGCVLVDLGAETTTVSVYYRDKLRNIAVIPLGNNNITKDLESLQMDEVEAETMKRKYGSAYTEVQDIDPNMTWPIDNSRSVSTRKFIEVVEARMLEIIENVRNLILQNIWTSCSAASCSLVVALTCAISRRRSVRPSTLRRCA